MIYTHILFDLDGTLTESAPGILNSVVFALSRFGITPPHKEELTAFIGPPLVDSFMAACGMSQADAERARGYYREYFEERGIFENEVYDGIDSVLVKLKEQGRGIALATSKPEIYAKRILEHYDLEKYFDVTVGGSLDNSLMRKEDIVRVACEKCGANSDKILMVGDRRFDIFGANEAKIDSCGVLYGYGNRDELEKAGATYIVEDVNALFALFDEV